MKGANTIALLENIEVTVDRDPVEARVMGSVEAQDLIAGDITYNISVDKLYADPADFFNEVTGGSSLTIEIRPKGTGTGKPKFTATGAIITSWGYRHPRNDWIRERVRFRAKTIQAGAQA